MNTRRNRFYACITTLFFSNCLYAFPAPGSYISNIASGDYSDETGNILMVNSNPVSLEVQKTYALTLVQNQTQLGTAGGQVNFPHVLTNTGNTDDSYKLALSQLTNDQFNLDAVKVYVDRDQNGVPDDSNDLLTGVVLLSLKAGESISLIVVGSIPSNITASSKAELELTASSQFDSTLSALVNDTANVVDDAVISLLKAQDSSQGIVGDVITYSLTYRNNGTVSRPLTITDVLDDSLEYVAGSARWNLASKALTDAEDSEDAANKGIKYQLLADGKSIQADVDAVAPLTSGVLSFQVKVKNSNKTKIPNTAHYTFISGIDNNQPIKNDLDSNTVNYTLAPQLGVVLNNKSSSAANAGHPYGDPDNLVSKPELVPGKEVLFKNYVWNTGNTTDVYNLSYQAANLPACAQVRLYSQDGKTLLTDTNGDGVIDTGSLAGQAVKEIQVGVFANASCNSEVKDITVDVTAVSVLSSSITDPVRNVIEKLAASSSESDLYNSDNSGKDVGKIDNNGNAWLKKSVVNGTVIFPLVAENKSAQSNNYNLYASFSVIDPQNISVSTAAGFTVKFYEGDTACTALGKQITNTGTMAGGAVKNYCAVISVDASQQNFEKPVWFAIQSPVNQQADAIKNAISSSAARQLILSNDQQSQVAVGGTIVYVHTLKNNGTVTEGADGGSVVTFKVNPLKPDDSFIYSLYYDANKDGKIDASDKFIDANTDLSTLTAKAGIAAQADIQLLLKVQAPAAATEGVVSPAEIIVVSSKYLDITLDDLKNTDVTTISATAMQLAKYQVKASSCGMTFNQANVEPLNFTVQPLAVKPNECVIYKLEIENKGSSVVTNVQFSDAVPAYTQLNGTPFLVPAGTNGSSGESIKGTLSSLAAGQKANMYFMIRVNP